mgnify:CR=1 FL=1|jgi:stage II sporulation protein D
MQRLKKALALVITSFFIMVSFSNKTEASLNIVNYVQPVEVEIAKNANLSVVLNGLYYIKNIDKNEQILVKPGITVNFKKSSSKIAATFGAFNLTASKIEIQEITGAKQVVTFSGTVGAKSQASNNYPDVLKYYNGEAAEYVSTYNNSWYIIKAKNGKQLAVPKNQYVSLQNVPSVNLLQYNSRLYRGSFYYNSNLQLVNKLSMDDYLKGVVPNEMPSSWHIEALKAQAVAARSYAYVKSKRGILTSTVSSQVYHGYSSQKGNSNAAVDQTKGKVVMYKGSVIETFFHSTSGGKTANVGDVWNSNQANFPYLITREDPYEASPYSSWKHAYNTQTILNSFGLGNAILYDISIKPKGVNGEVGSVTINTSQGSKTIEGNELKIRNLFPVNANAYKILESNWFTLTANKTYSIQTTNGINKYFAVKKQKVQLANTVSTITNNTVSIQTNNGIVSKSSDPQTIILNGKGWGHRIGMSQYGAKGFAEHGWKYDQILKHYFYGTTINSIY